MSTEKKQASIIDVLLGVSMGVVGGAVVFVALGSSMILYQGFVLSWLWYWFVVPLEVPAVSVVWAAGLMAIGHLLIPHVVVGPFDAIKLINPYKVILTVGHHTMTTTLAAKVSAHSDGFEAQIKQKETEKLIWGLARPAVALALGWFVHLFM